MSGFTLGQRVRFAEHIKRTAKDWQDETVPDRYWTGQSYPGARWPGGEGIIIGKRTLSDGNVRDMGEEGTVYEQTRTFTAYLIVTSLHSAPVHVLPEHLTPLEVAGDDEPTHQGWDSEHFGATGCDGSLHPEDCLGTTHQGADS